MRESKYASTSLLAIDCPFEGWKLVKMITAKLADAIIEGRQGEDAVAAVEAEFAASEAQVDSIEEIVESA